MGRERVIKYMYITADHGSRTGHKIHVYNSGSWVANGHKIHVYMYITADHGSRTSHKIHVYNHRRPTTGLIFFFFFFFFAFSPVWRPLRYVHAIILPLKPFLSTLVYGLLYRQGRKRGVLV